VKCVEGEEECPHAIAPPAIVVNVESNTPQHNPPHRPSFGQVFSPPLPALQKMEHQNIENPFRPDGDLSHQVEPIIETYKTRPYPKGHDEADAAKPKSPTKKEKKEKKKKEKKEKDVVRPSDVSLQMNESHTVEVKRTTVSSPKAGKVEFVHVEESKKRKCGCCSVQ